MDNKETDILWKISEGDLQALESLFLEYQPKLVAFIDKFISDHEQARDMASDIFLEIWKKRHGLRKVRCFSAYLFRMARFQVYNYYDHQHVIQGIGTRVGFVIQMILVRRMVCLRPNWKIFL